MLLLLLLLLSLLLPVLKHSTRPATEAVMGVAVRSLRLLPLQQVLQRHPLT